MDQTYLLTEATRSRILAALSQLDPSKPWQITVGPHRKPRSETANRRLWALHTLASKATGYTTDELHELALARFFGTKQIVIGGTEFEVPLKRSSARNVKEFAEFMEATEIFYIKHLGVFLP